MVERGAGEKTCFSRRVGIIKEKENAEGKGRSFGGFAVRELFDKGEKNARPKGQKHDKRGSGCGWGCLCWLPGARGGRVHEKGE